jgi:hypothetical protein
MHVGIPSLKDEDGIILQNNKSKKEAKALPKTKGSQGQIPGTLV